MKKLHGLQLLLVQHLRNLSWVSKGNLTAEIIWKHPRGKNAGKRYLPETVGRALRLLEEQKILAVRSNGLSVEYKYIPSELRERYIPSSARPDGERNKLFRERIVEGETEVEIQASLPYKN